jgi:hypothetical protein
MLENLGVDLLRLWRTVGPGMERFLRQTRYLNRSDPASVRPKRWKACAGASSEDAHSSVEHFSGDGTNRGAA